MARRRRPRRPARPVPARRRTSGGAALAADALDRPSLLRRWAAILLPTVLSALLLMTAYPLPDVGLLAWIALVPWVVVVLRAPSSRAVWGTWPIWWLWWVVMMHWLRFATGLGWMALAVYTSVYFPVAGLLLRLLHNRFRVPTTLALPVVWVGLEYVRGVFGTGFPWFFLGHTQHRYLGVIQIADLVGVGGVTFVVAAVNGLVVDLLTTPLFRGRPSGPAAPPGRRPRLRPGIVLSVVGVAALVGATLVYGRCRLAQGRRTLADGLTVAAIQGNIPQEVKRSGQSDQAILDEHVTLTERVLDDPLDLIVWPETMVPGSINTSFLNLRSAGGDARVLQRYIDTFRSYRAQVEMLAASAGVPILVGNVTTEYDAEGTRRRFNSALLIEPDGQTGARYDKIHLVPFGEYVPLRRYFPWLMNLTPYDYDYTLTPGDDPTVFQVGGSRFAVAICFEDTVPQVVRRLAYARGGEKRIDFLVNISNDGWFKATSELPQHLAICVFRAVENRVGIVRSVNTGISAFIDPNGRVVKDLRDGSGRRRGVAGTLVGTVATDSRRTVYGRGGEVFSMVLSGLLGVLSVYGIGRFAATRHGARRAKKRGSRGDFA